MCIEQHMQQIKHMGRKSVMEILVIGYYGFSLLANICLCHHCKRKKLMISVPVVTLESRSDVKYQ